MAATAGVSPQGSADPLGGAHDGHSSAPHMHVLVGGCSNVRRFLLLDHLLRTDWSVGPQGGGGSLADPPPPPTAKPPKSKKKFLCENEILNGEAHFRYTNFSLPSQPPPPPALWDADLQCQSSPSKAQGAEQQWSEQKVFSDIAIGAFRCVTYSTERRTPPPPVPSAEHSA